MHYETKGYKFSLSGVEHAWKALVDVSYSSEMDTEEFNEETVQVEHYNCEESEKNQPLELGYKGSKANLGTESERYTFVSFSDVCLTCVKPRLHERFFACDGDAIFLKLSRRQRAAKITCVATL